MRSRYSAYVLKNEIYLLKTWHESTRPESLENKVHFVAYFTQNTLNIKKTYALTEISDFIKDKNWFYLDGTEVKTIQLTKNMFCPCLSGKKYKRCCGKT